METSASICEICGEMNCRPTAAKGGLAFMKVADEARQFYTQFAKKPTLWWGDWSWQRGDAVTRCDGGVAASAPPLYFSTALFRLRPVRPPLPRSILTFGQLMVSVKHSYSSYTFAVVGQFVFRPMIPSDLEIRWLHKLENSAFTLSLLVQNLLGFSETR